MAKKKADSIKVRLANKETGYFYNIKKNSKSDNTKGKMKFRKYDPKLRKHVEFTETKEPSGGGKGKQGKK
ncbi:MAG: 50S ribosomal protein L33 [Alphaproteobacteria bacterium]|nr:50S ribosomal protein L33 [Alphaproteobacteria bacterium]